MLKTLCCSTSLISSSYSYLSSEYKRLHFLKTIRFKLHTKQSYSLGLSDAQYLNLAKVIYSYYVQRVTL